MTSPSLVSGSSSPRAQELDWLTIVRIVPAVWVVFFHLESYGRLPFLRDSSSTGLLDVLIRNGHHGVQFFFLLSGFILAHVYSARQHVPVKRFLQARFARLYPLHLTGLALAAYKLPEIFRDHEKFHEPPIAHLLAFAKCLLVVPLGHAWWDNASLVWNGPSWSLSAEAFFYAVFPFLLPKLVGLGPRALVAAFAGCVLASSLPSLMEEAFALPPLRFNPLASLPVFVTGIALQQLVVRGLLRLAWWLAPLFAVLFWASFALSLQPIVAESTMLLGISGIIACLADPKIPSLEGIVLRSLRLLGCASFPLYMIHIPILLLFLDFVPLDGSLFLVVYLATILTAAILAHLAIEVPARKVLLRWFG